MTGIMEKRKLILTLSILFMTLAVNARDIINFNNGWTFGKSILTTNFSKKVVLPHSWQRYETDPVFNGYRGGCQYLKEFNVPFAWSNKNVYIRFNGVASIANIFVNGRYVGGHRGAYTAFTFNLTPFLRFGASNTILVNVDNSVQLDVMPLSGDFNVYGGIYRDVELIVTDKIHVSTTHFSSDGVYVKQGKLTPAEAEIDVQVMLSGQYGDKTTTRVTIKKERDVIAKESVTTTINLEGDQQVNIPIKIKNPRMWNGRKDPFLYNCIVEIIDVHNNVKDRVETTFGLRSVFVNRNKGFILNNQNYPLYGVTYIQDRDEIYSAMTSLNRREDMDIIEEIGATAIRTSNAPHDKHVYEMTDRNGIIAWVDLPFTGDDIDKGASFINSLDFINNGKEQLEEMIYQLYNHPSIVFWGLFSNIAGYGDNPIPFVKELNSLSKTISPNVLTVACSNEDGAINNITDVISWSQYLGWRSRKLSDIDIWLNTFRSGWNSLKPGVGEYGAGASIHHQDVTASIIAEKDRWHPEVYQTDFHIHYTRVMKNRPYIWGYFVNSIFDYGSSHRFNGDKSGVSDMGLVTYNRHTKKDAFYLYKALWNRSEEFIYITQKRVDKRSSKRQNLTVFSSCKTVDLIVNGISHSTVTPIDGVARWNGVILNIGKNTIVASCGDVSDKIEIEIYN